MVVDDTQMRLQDEAEMLLREVVEEEPGMTLKLTRVVKVRSGGGGA